jgi:uncharacterized membrane protein HdeD (DUF308 family)
VLSAAAWVALVLQLIMLYAPDVPGPDTFFIPRLDLVAHCVSFGLAAGLWTALVSRPYLIGALFAVHAFVSEAIQAAWLTRTGDWWDIVADLVGVAAGVVIGLRALRGWRRG